MKPRIRINSREFDRAMGNYAKTIKSKVIPDSLNKQAPFVILRAMKETTKTLTGRITSELGGIGRPTMLGRKIIFARARAKGIKLTHEAMIAAFNSMLNARRAAVRYVSLGWLPALEGVGRKVARPLKSSSTASKEGGAKKANKIIHKVTFWNGAPGILKVGKSALKSALSNSASNIRRFTLKRLDREAKKYKSNKR